VIQETTPLKAPINHWNAMKNKVKFTKPISSDHDGLRFATPEIVAKYRARRLKCDVLADISCGIGGQTIFFAKECKKVYAIEIDPVKIEHAKKNCQLYGVDNVEFICGDALDPEVINKLPELDVVFSDPARPPKEKSRLLSSITPSLEDMIGAYSSRTKGFVFEVPPQLTPERIPFDCEMEYLSLNGKINRLTLYFNHLKKCNRSAVTLPSGESLCGSGTGDIPESEIMKKFAYEPEPSVVKAELLPEIAEKMSKGENKAYLFRIDSKRVLITSDEKLKCPLLKNQYTVLAETKVSVEDINRKLKELNAKNALIRGKIDPDNYWNLRNSIEAGLNGDKAIHLYITDSSAIICQPLVEKD